jgi:hypothetical protein
MLLKRKNRIRREHRKRYCQKFTFLGIHILASLNPFAKSHIPERDSEEDNRQRYEYQV